MHTARNQSVNEIASDTALKWNHFMAHGWLRGFTVTLLASLVLVVLSAACSTQGTTGPASSAPACSLLNPCPSGQTCNASQVCVPNNNGGDISIVADVVDDSQGTLTDATAPADVAVVDGAADSATDGDLAGGGDTSGVGADATDADVFDPTQQCKPTGKDVCNGLDDNCDGKTDEGFPDQDGDGIADCVDSDVDGDGVPNNQDNCPKTYNPDQQDKDFNNIGDACDKDTDGDGLKDSQDDCPTVINPEQQDMDGDGIGDACDDDMDGDGIPNAKDNCPKTYNKDQKDTDKDGIGDACDDKDKDGLPWNQDNCPTVANPTQKDTDNDGLGDACDPDMDDDGIPNEKDNCPGIANPNQKDTDGNGVGDACQGDADGDGCPDKLDCKPLDPTDGCEYNGKGLKELCDGKDNNCNGQVDEGFGIGGECGLGVCSGGKVMCGSPSKSICNTEIGGTNPKQNVKELCNGLDDNCDGIIPQDEQDGDGDTFRVCDGDCDDDNPAVCPSSKLCPEVCDGLDNDCNGLTDDGDVCKGLGEIMGYIYDASQPGTILNKAKVELRDPTCAVVLLSQQVDANGKFSFPSKNGPNGIYCLKVTLIGYEDQTSTDVSLGDFKLGVNGYPTVRQVDFGLKPFGYPFEYAGIAGKVWNDTKSEIKVSQVIIKASGNQIATDQTDFYANYTAVALSPETVDVTVLANGFEAQTKTVNLKANTTLIVDFVLAKSKPKVACFADSFEWLVNPGWVVECSCGNPGVGKCPGFHRIDNTQVIKDVYASFPNGGNPTQPLVQIYGENMQTLKAPDGTKQYWYGADDDGSFIGSVYSQGGYTGGHGSASNGTLTSPDIDLQGANKFVMTVQYWYEIEAENPKSYDVMQVQVSETGKNSYTTLKQLNPVSDNYNASKAYTSAGFATTPVWVTVSVDLSSYKGKKINVRFRFNSGDGLFNGYRGWGIDNIKFICT